MIEIKKNEAEGFETVFSNDRFKCAFISHSDAYSYGKVSEMKRHNKTDEIFVLLCGNATLLTYENDTFTETFLIKNEAVNVRKGTWHYLAVSKEALLFVCENSDTNKGNTDVLNVEYVL